MLTEIISLYENGNGVMTIAETLGIHRSTVQRSLLRGGVTLRKSTPRNGYDLRFFENVTKESAYWAGFIAADGYIRSNGRSTLSIKLSLVDYDHLLKFKRAIGFLGEVHKTDEYAYIDISGNWITEALRRNFNITSRKTHTLVFPILESEFIPHFIRGYFDGDGCISRTTVPSVSFTCASPEFVQTLQTIIFETVEVRLKSKNNVPPVQNGVQISYSGKNAGKILRWMYQDSTPDIRLDRKFEKAYSMFASIQGD